MSTVKEKNKEQRGGEPNTVGKFVPITVNVPPFRWSGQEKTIVTVIGRTLRSKGNSAKLFYTGSQRERKLLSNHRSWRCKAGFTKVIGLMVYRMGVPGVGMEGSVDRNKKRGWSATLTMLLALILLVGMTKIHAMVAEYGSEQEWADELKFEHEVIPSRRLSELELHQEAQRRMVLEQEYSRRILATSGGYYIGYGALSASRVSCPPRSGRSYYTRRCNSASGPVRPYSRGCSTISRCARDG
ncbi:hypothetical protein R1flu_022164 [Riccia fluitans]|uniref:Uncharacterized protein n=1 Tax=Riccia fluitans TaxID=41844 RepID=A0ABD1ZSR6_9MARC